MKKPIEALKILKDAVKADRTIDEYSAKELLDYIKNLEKIIKTIDDLAVHIDDTDMMPVFEIKPECSWQLANKGLIHCVKEHFKGL